MPHNEYFQGNPTRLDISRSRMTLKPRWTGTWNTGKLVPIFATSLIMPGDTVKMDVSAAIRTLTPKFPVMDDMDITIEAFFVPHRLILSRKSMSPDVSDSNHSFAAFLGAQDSLLNMPTPGEVHLPHFTVAESGYHVGGLGDCLGFPKPASGQSYVVNVLKPLAYWSIWNDYFREPSTASPLTYSIGSGDACSVSGSDALNGSGSYNTISGLDLAPVCRYHGYFGSCLPWPQRNTTEVTLPLGVAAPVMSLDEQFIFPGDSYDAGIEGFGNGAPLKLSGLDNDRKVLPPNVNSRGLGMSGSSDDVGYNVTGAQGSYGADVAPVNLWADLSQATSASINQLRLSIQTQRWFEALARGGNKLEDLTYSMFGVRGPDVATRGEYLGGVRIPISISQVANTTGGTASVQGQLSLGSTGAFSLTNLNNFLFTKSFTEHGTLMVVACCRVHDSFGQGLSAEDFKFDKFNYYWPQLANLGEKPVFGREIYVTGAAANDNAIFGYQEAWAEYRMIPDMVTGKCRPGQDLEFVTYVNNFASLPTLKGFLNAASQKDNVDKTLQVASSTAGFQFYGQFQFDITMTRPMPLYSIPGLMDHH